MQFELRQDYPDRICDECEELARVSYTFLKKYESSTKYLDGEEDLKEEIIIISSEDNVQLSPTSAYEETDEVGDNIEDLKIKEELSSDSELNYEEISNKDVKKNYKKIGVKNIKTTYKDIKIENIHSSSEDNSTKKRKRIYDYEDLKKNCEEGKKNLRIYKCQECPKTYFSHSGLYIHNKTNHSDEEITKLCFICGASVKNLKAHMINHMNFRPFKCSLCDKTFKSKHNWKRHSLVHTGEKDFICYKCAKPFNCLSNLKIHEKIHEREELKVTSTDF